MALFLSVIDFIRRLTAFEASNRRDVELTDTSRVDIVRATVMDVPFIIEAYRSATVAETVVQVPRLPEFVRRSIEVSNRERSHDPHPHPFVESQPLTIPIDDIFLLRMGDARVGLLWLRDYNDRHLAPQTFGEIFLLWLRPDFRGRRYWPQVDNFSRKWAVDAKKTMLVGRCLRPSRRMAALFQRSGYKCLGTKPSGMSVRAWHVSKRNAE